MIEVFQPFGVTRDQIEKRIQRRVEAITPAQVISLRKIYNSLRDQMSSKEDWFEMSQEGEPMPEAKSGTEAAKEAIKRKRATKSEAPVQEVPPVQDQPPEPLVDDSIPQPTKFLYCQEKEQRIPAGFPGCETCEASCEEWNEWRKHQSITPD